MGLLTRDSECSGCHGSRRIYSKWDGKDIVDCDEPCGDCLGTGDPLTDAGRELVEFIRTHYGLEPQVK